MRMIMIIVAVLLLLGGGAGGYFYFMVPAEASLSEDHEEEAKKHVKRDPGAFVELDPLILPIVDYNGVSQVVSLVIALEVPPGKMEESVKAKSPKLKNEFIKDVYGTLNEHAMNKGGTLEIGVIKERLSGISKDILGDENVYDVLVQVVQQRPV